MSDFNNRNENDYNGLNNQEENNYNEVSSNQEENNYNDFLDNREPNNKKKKKGSNKAIAGTVAIAITASLIGGGVGGFGVYKAMKDSNDDVNVSKEKESEKEVVVPKFKSEATMTTAEAVEKVTPAVVGVSTKSIVLDQYFKSPMEQEGIGSGFIISEDGLIVTNYHVIKGAQEVKVILSDGSEVAAKVVNYDEQADLAVIDVTENVKMPGVATLGDSSTLKSGEDVIAIGNPLGKEFSKTVTKGIISSPNRQLSVSGEEGATETFIQTDAAINPGNSGGPLINAKGEVIGVNTAKKVGEEIEGIGFSIPINTVKEKLDSLSKPILVLGITAHDITPELAQERNIPEGIRIKTVADFSPAEKAGLRTGDIITAYNNKKVKTVEELNKAKESSKEGDVVNLTVFRDGKTIQVDLKLESF